MSFENLYDDPKHKQSYLAVVDAWKNKIVNRQITLNPIHAAPYTVTDPRDLKPRLVGFIDAATGEFRELSPSARIARGLRADYYRLRDSSNFRQVAAWVYAKCN